MIDYTKARRLLARRDPVLRDLMRRHGPCGLANAQHTDPFRALVHAIIAQQLSTKASATIETRFATFFDGTPTPTAVAATSDARLRAIGFSTQKLRYLRDLCRRVEDGTLPLAALDQLPDEDVIAALTQVKGIGRWTAEMFLMFHLVRPDVLPLADLGLQRAMRLHYNRGRALSVARMRRIGAAWAPWRSVATWYLWRSLDPVPVEY
jgi:DNA-3-methyladenine glycosylase II